MSKSITAQEYFTRVAKRHQNKYDYSESVFNGLKQMITIICPEHGKFQKRASVHLYQGGCQLCGWSEAGKKNSDALPLTTEQFLDRAIKLHGSTYDYTNVNYVSAKDVVIIKCPVHGEFNQRPFQHLRGSGCPKCASVGRSIDQDLWLDSLECVPGDIIRNCRISLTDGTYLVPDGFRDNTFFEYWGDWAHGNPKFYKPEDMNMKFKRTFGELYEATLVKRQRILDNGFNLVEIWEHEWKEKK